MNTDAPWPSLDEARVRVLKIRPSCTNGRSTALIVGSVTCSTSSAIPPSWWSARIMCGAIEEHERPGSSRTTLHRPGWRGVPARAAR